MSSPSAGSVSFHQTCSLAQPSGVRPPLSTISVGAPRWRTQVRELGGDVAGVEIDHHGLHLQDVGGAGLAGARRPCRG